MNAAFLALLIAGVLLALALFGAIVWLVYTGRQTAASLLRRIDNRGWFSIGLFGLSAAIFAMLGVNPALEDNKLFSTLAQGIVLTGLINLAASYLYGASKNDPPAPPVPVNPEPKE